MQSSNDSVVTIESFCQLKSTTKPTSFYHYFIELLEQFGDHQAVTDPEKCLSWTYHQFVDSMKQMVQRINNIGVKNGDIIGTFIGNSVSYLLFTIAAISVGAVVLPLNPSYKMNEIQKYFSQVNIQWILAEQRCAYLFDKQQYKLIIVDTLIPVTECISSLSNKRQSNGSNVEEMQDFSQSGGFIFYSSGTSGNPKGAFIGTEQLIANIEIIRQLAESLFISLI